METLFLFFLGGCAPLISRSGGRGTLYPLFFVSLFLFHILHIVFLRFIDYPLGHNFGFCNRLVLRRRSCFVAGGDGE